MKNVRLFHLLLLSLSVQTIAQIEHKQVYTYDFDVRGELKVENEVGAVTVTGSDTHNKITFEATKRANTKDELALFDIRYDISDKETEAKITSHNVKRVQNAQIDLNIIVPRYTELDIEAGVGAITVQNVKGQMKTETKTGSISIAGARKEVEARAQTGDVKVAFAADGFGKTDIKVGSGNISVANSGGSVEAKSDNGNISIEQRVLPHKEDIDAKTGLGNVKVSLPLEVNVTVKAESKTGTIADGGLQWMRKPLKEGQPKSAGDKASVVLGKGFADVDLETKSGSVAVNLR